MVKYGLCKYEFIYYFIFIFENLFYLLSYLKFKGRQRQYNQYLLSLPLMLLLLLIFFYMNQPNLQFD